MNMSSLYVDAIRVFMEFVDNSIDAVDITNALMMILTGNEPEINQPARIDIRVSGGWYKRGHVEISDNCSGIKDLKRIVENIGNSEKKSQAWLNGQFGYGLYSFLAICDFLEIMTKHKDNSYSEYVKISREAFLVDDLNDLGFEITQKTAHTPVSGTSVTLSGFDKEYWRNLDYVALKNEIEKHFELLLQNKSIMINITGPDGIRRKCMPFDYDTYDGVVYDKTVTIDAKKSKLDKKFGRSDIKIFLKYVPKVSMDRQPVIISKMRRVTELWLIKAFKSNHRREIWNHPSIIGYIDTRDLLNPTIARNDFKNDKNFKLVRKAITSLEDEIIETFKAASSSEIKRDFSEIESGFNSKLDGIFDTESDEKRHAKPGDRVIISEKGDMYHNVLLPDSKGSYVAEFKRGGKSGSGKGVSGNTKDSRATASLKANHTKEYVEPPSENNSRLKLNIDDTSEPIKDSEGREKRSERFGNIVTVYKKHSDFEKRVFKDKLGVELITTELISYLATQLLIHYTEFGFDGNPKNEEKNKKDMLLFFTENLYRLEDSLKSFINKPLSK